MKIFRGATVSRTRTFATTAIFAALLLAALMPGLAQAAGPTVVVSPASGAPGHGLTVSGTGWTAGDPIFVQIGSTTFDIDVVCVLTASSDGTIAGTQPNGSCQVPNVPAGPRSLVAIDGSNQAIKATGTNFTVKPGLTLAPANSTAGLPASPGVTVAIQGHGFAANSTVSTFKFDTTALVVSPASVSTDGNGNFTAPVTFTVPATSAGNHTVSATDSASKTGSSSLNVFVPQLALSPTSGSPGHGLTVSGTGWPAGDTIFVQIGSSAFAADIACTLTASSDGTVAGTQSGNSCQVPNVPAGSEPLVAIDDQSQGVRTSGTFAVKPTLVLTPANATAGSPASPGTSVSVQGHGFAANSTVSTFKLDATALVATPATVSTDANGNFSTSVTFTLPSTTAATHTVSAKDASSNTGSSPLKVYTPKLTLSPASGSPGRGLTVSGTGWPAGDAIFIQIGSTTFDTDVACTLTASSDGTIAGTQPGNSCQVPNVPKGTEPLTAIDDQNQGVRTTGTFAVTPVLVVAPSPASPGTTVTIQGHGFAANSTVSTFKFDTTALSTTPASVSTDASGNFSTSVTFIVPATTAASHTVSATDASTNTGSSQLRIYVPHISVSPGSGVPGHGLTVSGSGWPAGDAIFVQIGSTTFDTDVACVLTASSDGTIAGNQSNGSCQVPSVATGSQPLVAIDDQNQGVRATGTNFTVT